MGYFKSNDAKTPDVALGVILLPFEDLRCHVDGRAHDAGQQLPLSVNLFRKPKVTNFDFIGRQHYIIWL